jgi:hypothetical protein
MLLGMSRVRIEIMETIGLVLIMLLFMAHVWALTVVFLFVLRRVGRWCDKITNELLSLRH